MDNKYNPQVIEPPLIQQWEESGIFNPDLVRSEFKYSIVIPPPNVTGSLHIGHALVNTLQDVLIRSKRMQGYTSLWLPGTDHAGIATQMVVEKDLLARGLNKKDLTREQFVNEVWDWTKRYGGRIKEQLKTIGCSLDWSRERFTLDEPLSRAVNQAFVTFFRQGLIYKGQRLVNWCPEDQTALSDLEVDYIETEGSIYYINYNLEKGGSITIATTRPETLLGDVAIAVHPDDERYKNLVGQKAIVPVVQRLVPIVADTTCEMGFGSGAVKLTPAHDFNDFEIASRHDLPFINIFTKQAKINEVYPDFEGLDRFVARKEVLKILQKSGHLQAVKPHKYMLTYSQRKKSVVEPRLSEQWFFNVKPLAAVILQKMEQNELHIYPKTQQNSLKSWLFEIKDWCISRQLWWGHRIPAFFCVRCNNYLAFFEHEDKCCSKCGNKDLKQEEDVLDTWFSSGIFPFSTMGWPDDTNDYRDFYPNSTLVTAYDILFFWVARMLMMGIGLTGKLPFNEVYAHGLIRDENGKKMSKTAGNTIDPLNIVNQHGADALRLALCHNINFGQDIKLSEKDVIQSKSFLNKLFNAAKFVELSNNKFLEVAKINNLPSLEATYALLSKDSLTASDLENFKPLSQYRILEKWALAVAAKSHEQMVDSLEKYRFQEIVHIIHHFMWNYFCDTYLEIAKVRASVNQSLTDSEIELFQTSLLVLNLMFQQVLRLLHPIAPFLTEHLFQKFCSGKTFLATANYTLVNKNWQHLEVALAEDFLSILELVRSIKGEHKVHPKVLTKLRINGASSALKQLFLEESLVVTSLAKVSDIFFDGELDSKLNVVQFVFKDLKLQLELPLDHQKDSSSQKIDKILPKLIERKKFLENKMKNPAFKNKAPAQVVEKTAKELEQISIEIESLQSLR